MLFHFSESIYRNFEIFGLSAAYLENIMNLSVIRQIMALVLVNEKYVQPLFDNLGNDLHKSEGDGLSPLFKYFIDH